MSKGGGGSSPSGSTTSTQTSAPWAGQIPFLVGGGSTGTNIGNTPVPGTLPEAANLYLNYTPQYYPDSTVSPFNSTQQTGLNMQANYGLNGGASSVNAGNNALTAINSGALLQSGNPYLGNVANSVVQNTLPAIDSHFAGNGRYGSGANVNADTSAVANAVAPYAFNDYETQTGNLLKGAAEAPIIQAGQESAIQDVLNAGGAQQQQAQSQLNDQVNRFNYQQMLPYNKLNAYQGGVSGNFGEGSALTQPYFSQGGGKGGSGGKSGVGGTVAAVAPYVAKLALSAAA